MKVDANQDGGSSASGQGGNVATESEVGAQNDDISDMDCLSEVPREILKAAAMILKGVDITEVFSPERVTKIAREHGLQAGLNMDLRTGWDFRKKEDRRKAKKYIIEERPLLVIGSPVCTPFSALQRWNWGRTREGDRKLRQALEEATRYMEFVAELYAIQDANGRYYFHENPAQATSWQLACIQRVCGLRGAQVVTADQCMFGLRTPDGKGGTGLARNRQNY